jgi:polysaccharide pyruvyl transferase WcaK-like protein
MYQINKGWLIRLHAWSDAHKQACIQKLAQLLATSTSTLLISIDLYMY